MRPMRGQRCRSLLGPDFGRDIFLGSKHMICLYNTKTNIKHLFNGIQKTNKQRKLPNCKYCTSWVASQEALDLTSRHDTSLLISNTS